MVVYLNDKTEENTIVESFYSELVNQSKTKEELIQFHNKKIKDFLNKYYK